MSIIEELDDLAASAAQYGWTLSSDQVSGLGNYLKAVLTANEAINLTGVRDFREGVTRHLVDSLAFGLHLVKDASHPGVILDLGSGGGFPGVPAAVVCPDSDVILVESRRRKLDTVMGLVSDLRIANVRALCGRLRELARSGRLRETPPDLVLARAVAPLAGLVKESASCLAPGGTLICWKSGGLGEEERSSGLREAERRGLTELSAITYQTDRDNLLIRYQKQGVAP